MADKSILDSFFDAAEAVVGGVEKVTGQKELLWEVKEILDSVTGEKTFQITDGPNHLETGDEKLAKKVCNVLNA